MMNKAQYLKACRKAKRVFGYIQITEARKQATRISKAKAAGLVSQVSDHDKIDAEWADDEHTFLLVG